MADAQLVRVVHQLRRLAAGPGGGENNDQQLLHEFEAARSQAAFAALVERHGPLVLRVCRHVLRHEQDAEDAFQATFLVLARRAASLRRCAVLTGWLHGVAYRVAVQAKRNAARRRLHEARASAAPPRPPRCELAWHEVQAVLDEEIQRLPERYRTPFVLCVLEGHCRAEAARRLGVKEGTVWSRLAHARRRLQTRLSRRGIALGCALAAAHLAGDAARASVAAAVLTATVQAAVASAEGVPAGVSPEVAALLGNTVRTLAAVKVKVGLAVLLLAALVGAGAAALVGQAPALPLPPTNPPAVASGGAQERPATDRFGDPLPAGALARLGTVRLRRGFHVQGLAYSPDGKVLASAGGPRDLCLWDAASGRLLHDLGVQHAYSVAFSPDSRLMAAFDTGGLGLWDVARGKQDLRTAAKVHGVMCAVFSPDGKTVATGGFRQPVRLWDTTSGAEVRQMPCDAEMIGCLAFSPDGRLLAAAGRTKLIYLWHTASGASAGTLAGHAEQAHWAAFSPDGKTLASGSDDQTVRLWDVATRTERTILGEGLGAVRAFTFSPDGKMLATGHNGGAIRLWDPVGRKELRHWTAHTDSVNAMAFSPDGKTLASGAIAYSAVRLWDPDTGREKRPPGGPQAYVTGLEFDRAGRSLFVSAADEVVRRWDWTRGTESPQLSWHGGSQVSAMALMEAGPVAAYGLWKEGAAFLVGPGSVKGPRRLHGHSRPVWALAFTRDGRRLLSGGEDGTIRQWDAGTGKEVGSVQGFEDEMHALAYSPDGATFVTGSANRIRGGLLRGAALRLWDAATLKEVRALDCKDAVRTADFSPDGRLLCATVWSRPPQPRLWEVASGKERSFVLAVREGTALGFSPDSKLLAVAAEEPDNSLCLVEIASGQEVCRFKGHSAGVTAVAFSPDGRLLASGAGDANVVLWELSGGAKPQAQLDLEQCWTDLASAEAARAYAASWKLAAVPDKAVPFLAARLRPVAPLTDAGRRQQAQWLRELDSDDFSVRRRAVQELEKLDELAELALRDALKGKPTPEARRQITALLEAITNGSAQRLRQTRAVAALEHMGTSQARRLLADLGRGVPEAQLTREARATLRRLAKPFDGLP
jgi:RNA polymerase sigma factor (sigma-70 family)